MRLVGAVLKEISRLGHGQLVCFWSDVEMFTKCCADIWWSWPGSSPSSPPLLRPSYSGCLLQIFWRHCKDHELELVGSSKMSSQLSRADNLLYFLPSSKVNFWSTVWTILKLFVSSGQNILEKNVVVSNLSKRFR